MFIIWKVKRASELLIGKNIDYKILHTIHVFSKKHHLTSNNQWSKLLHVTQELDRWQEFCSKHKSSAGSAPEKSSYTLFP